MCAEMVLLETFSMLFHTKYSMHPLDETDWKLWASKLKA